jgi:hypothetical protein
LGGRPSGFEPGGHVGFGTINCQPAAVGVPGQSLASVTAFRCRCSSQRCSPDAAGCLQSGTDQIRMLITV